MRYGPNRPTLQTTVATNCVCYNMKSQHFEIEDFETNSILASLYHHANYTRSHGGLSYLSQFLQNFVNLRYAHHFKFHISHLI